VLDLFLVLLFVAALDLHDYDGAEDNVADDEANQTDLAERKLDTVFDVLLPFLGVNDNVFGYFNQMAFWLLFRNYWGCSKEKR